MVPLALIMGTALGLFVDGYWLALLLPAESKQLLFLTALLVMLGAGLYWLVLSAAVRRLASMPSQARGAAMCAALLLAVLLLFGGTAQWRLPARYITLLLPTHSLELRASEQAPRGLALAWFNTSLGDVSYGMLSVNGWKRVGDALVLEDPARNSIQWQGRTGEEIQLIFRSTMANQGLRVAWDGRAEDVPLPSGRSTYSHRFAVPWYASSLFVYVLGIIALAVLALLVLLLLWERREAVSAAVHSSVGGAGRWDRSETLFLAAAAVLALGLRLINLGTANPAVDEYFHLAAARQLVEGASLGSVYSRGLWIVTLPVSLAFRMFGYQLWAARLAGALVNVLGIWPLYLRARRINRPVAVLSVLLYVTSPWITTFARLTREYAYYPVFAYWIILGMVSFLDRVPQELVLARDWRTVLTPKTMLIAGALVLPPIYAFVVDPTSTFRAMMIAYVVFAGFLLARFDWRSRQNMPVLALFAVVLLAAGYAVYARDTAVLVLVPQLNTVPVAYFFPDPPQQWYFGRVVLLAAVATLAAIAGSVAVRRLNPVPLFVLALFAAYLAFFTFLSKQFFHTRHLTTTELWYVVLLACGLYFGWRVLQVFSPWRSRSTGIAVAAILALALTNAGQVLLPVTSASPDNAISEDYLHDMSAVQAYLLAHVQPQDVLVSTVYGLYNSWVESPRFQGNYRITTQTPRDQVLALIDQHQSGWIVIDQIRLDMSTLGPHAFAENADVEYIGLFGDQNVWHWQHAPGAVGNTAVAGKAP